MKTTTHLPLASSGSALRPQQLAAAIGMAWICTVPAYAQSSAAESQVMGIQTVASSRLALNRSELAATVQVIDSEALNAQIQMGLNLKEAIGQLVPGIDLGNQGRSSYGQNLRGRPMLVMIDGVSLNSSRGTARQLDSVDPFQIASIEVMSGASALYGGGATGGIINIITKKATDAPSPFSSEVGVVSGFNNSNDHQIRLAQSVSGGNEFVQGRLGIAVQDNATFFDAKGNAVRTDTVQTDLQNTRSIDALGNLQFNLGQGQNLDLTAHYYRNKLDGSDYLYAGHNFGGFLSNGSLLEQRSGFSSDVLPMTERTMLNANYHANDVLGGHDLYVQGFWRQEEISFAPFPNVHPSVGLYSYATKQNTDVMGLKAALSKSMGALNVSYGIDFDRENFDSSMSLFDRSLAGSSGGLVNRTVAQTGLYPDYRVDGTSLFTQLDWKLSPRTTLSAGVRQQHMALKVDDFVGMNAQVGMGYGSGTSAQVIPGGNNSYNVTLLNFGLQFKPLDKHSTWLNYSEGFELPDPGKYFGAGNYTLSNGTWGFTKATDPASAPLQGIKTRQVEWGGKGKQGNLSYQTALFYAWSDRSIELDRTNMLINLKENKRRNFGWEGQLNYAVTPRWNVGGTWLLITSQKREQGDWKRQGIDTASPSKLTLHTDYHHGNWYGRLQATHQRTLEDGQQHAVKGFTTVDLLTHTQVGKGQLSIGVQNLFNRQYLTTWAQRAAYIYSGMGVKPEAFAFNGRGRTLSVNYTVNY